MSSYYTIRRCIQLYGSSVTRSGLVNAEKSGLIPTPERMQTGSIATRVWPIASLPKLGARYGFLRPPREPTCIAVFSAKGGVFKTSLALNIARMAALHNIRTCVIGLDFQCDVTRALGVAPEEEEDIESALAQIEQMLGLADYLAGRPWEDVCVETDLPTLDLLPETGELIALDRHISTKERREYVLQERVVQPLKKEYDLIVLDCSPNWNHLISNALVACDVLVSPLECKISQFNNLLVFRRLIERFRDAMRLTYTHLYVPTRFTPNRRLSVEIRNWYMANIPGVTTGTIRESAVGEEAMAARLSLPEHQPTSPYADEMRDLLRDIWTEISGDQAVRQKTA